MESTWQEREAVTRGTLRALSHQWGSVLKERSQQNERVGNALREAQRTLVKKAIATTRQELANTALEGDAGVLETIWRYKEDHRDQIKALEQERKRTIRKLERRFEDTIQELYTFDP